MNIRGKRILLRAISIDDLPLLHGWFNDPEIAPGLGDAHFPSSLFHQEAWFKRALEDEATVRLAVEHMDATLIGYTGFWEISWRDGRAEHAVVIGSAHNRGKGYGREVIATCCRYAFEEMGLYRLDARVLETNRASLRAYQACGFQIEGTLRQHALRGGQRINLVLLGLLASEYASWVQRTHYWETPADST